MSGLFLALAVNTVGLLILKLPSNAIFRWPTIECMAWKIKSWLEQDMNGVAFWLHSNWAHRVLSCECMISAKESEETLVKSQWVWSRLGGNSKELNCDTIGMMRPKSGEAPSSPNIIGKEGLQECCQAGSWSQHDQQYPAITRWYPASLD